ncbi:MAG: hypothetical protein AB7F89_26950 [Pirellulaceae bacterium]
MNPPSPPPRLQFHLSYLIYLLTLSAVSLALLRRSLNGGGSWPMTAVISSYLAVLTAYFAFRLPVLLRRLTRHRAAARLRREEMSRYLSEKQRAARSQRDVPVSGDEAKQGGFSS